MNPDDLPSQIAQARLLLDSYRSLTGRRLLPETDSDVALAHDLYHAPFVVLAHDAGADPVFTYANLAAQERFAMSREQIIGLPSRFSAEPLVRAARQRLLERVAADGFIDDYCGVRVARDGRRFEVRNATVWNLTSDDGQRIGQAAMFSEWRDLD